MALPLRKGGAEFRPSLVCSLGQRGPFLTQTSGADRCKPRVLGTVLRVWRAVARVEVEVTAEVVVEMAEWGEPVEVVAGWRCSNR